ncbi:hypothetical protein [Ruania alba]|nr:hypothetical protein [Ruania alba]
MKTTIDLPDPLVRRVRAAARERGVTMRELMIDGLYSELERWEQREQGAPSGLVFRSFGGDGLDPELDPAEVIELSYGLSR